MGKSKATPEVFDPTSQQGRAIVGVIVAWSLAWKGASMWRAAKDDSKPWFIALFAINTLGLLDAVYLFGVSPRRRARTGGSDRARLRRAQRTNSVAEQVDPQQPQR